MKGGLGESGTLPGGGCSCTGLDLPKYTTVLHSAAGILKLAYVSGSPGGFGQTQLAGYLTQSPDSVEFCIAVKFLSRC